MNAELMDRFDKSITRVAQKFFDDEKVNELKEIKFTQDRAEKFGEMMEDYVTQKSDDSKHKETIDKYRKQIEELNGKLEQTDNAWKQKLSEHEKEFKNNLLKRDVYTIASNYQLQDAFTSTDEIKKSIYDIVWNKLNEESVPRYDERGAIRLFTHDDPEMELYRDNKRVDVKELVESAISPYTKKSDPPKEDNKPRFEEPTKSAPTKEMNPMVRARFQEAGLL